MGFWSVTSQITGEYSVFKGLLPWAKDSACVHGLAPEMLFRNLSRSILLDQKHRLHSTNLFDLTNCWRCDLQSVECRTQMNSLQ